MARTVKIPDCSSTFDVFLNGIKHSFLGGTEVEVEDEIANLIEQHIKEHTPKEAPKTVAPFGAGGESPFFIVTFVRDGDTWELSCEQTYDEIETAIRDGGKIPMARIKVTEGQYKSRPYEHCSYYFENIDASGTEKYIQFRQLASESRMWVCDDDTVGS